MPPSKLGSVRFTGALGKPGNFAGWPSVSACSTQPLVHGHQDLESKDLLWVAMQGWKYWKNIKGLSHRGLAHSQITDFPVIHVFFWKTSSLSSGEYYSLKSIKFYSSHPWEAPAAGLLHSSQWLWSPWLLGLQPRCLWASLCCVRARGERKELTSHVSFPVPGLLGCLVYNLLGSSGNAPCSRV